MGDERGWYPDDRRDPRGDGRAWDGPRQGPPRRDPVPGPGDPQDPYPRHGRQGPQGGEPGEAQRPGPEFERPVYPPPRAQPPAAPRPLPRRIPQSGAYDAYDDAPAPPSAGYGPPLRRDEFGAPGGGPPPPSRRGPGRPGGEDPRSAPSDVRGTRPGDRVLGPPPGRSPEGRVNPDIDLDEVDPGGRSRAHGGPRASGGNRRKLGLAAGGVVLLAIIGYVATRPSGGGGGDTATAPLAQSGAQDSASATGTAGATAPASPSASAASNSAVDDATVHVAVLNGSMVAGRAAGIKSALIADGFSQTTVGGNAAKAAETKIYYPASGAASAAAVAHALGVPAANLAQSSTYTVVTVVIGVDWTTGTTYPAG